MLTLLEVLVRPLEMGTTALADEFREALTSTATLRVMDIDRPIAERAATIRASYGYRTPDAIHLATAVSR